MSSPRKHIRSKIQALYDAGISIRGIANQLSVSRATVQKWVRKPDGDVADASRSGRPSKMTPNSKERVRRLMQDKIGVGTRRVAKQLNFSADYQERHKTISHSCISGHVRGTSWGYPYVQPVKPLLTEKNLRDRVSFCTRMKAEGFADDSPQGRVRRAHILFTDESPVELFPMPNRQNRRIRTNKPENIPPIRIPKAGLKIMVAGGISRYGKTDLVVVDEKETVTGQYYRSNILPAYAASASNKQQFPVPEKVILMQDGAPAHTARATLDHIKKAFPTVWTDWPGNSPDLNPVEHIWARLQDSVLKPPRPRNREQLIRRVQQEWDAVNQEDLRNLVESFGARVLECLEKNGNSTHY